MLAVTYKIMVRKRGLNTDTFKKIPLVNFTHTGFCGNQEQEIQQTSFKTILNTNKRYFMVFLELVS